MHLAAAVGVNLEESSLSPDFRRTQPESHGSSPCLKQEAGPVGHLLVDRPLGSQTHRPQETKTRLTYDPACFCICLVDIYESQSTLSDDVTYAKDALKERERC